MRNRTVTAGDSRDCSLNFIPTREEKYLMLKIFIFYSFLPVIKYLEKNLVLNNTKDLASEEK